MTKPTQPPGTKVHLGGQAWSHIDHNLVPIDTVTPYPGNPRRGDQPAITASIRDHGLYRPIITQTTTGHALAGNHTLRGLIDLGATQVPVQALDVDDTRARAIVARDNKTSDPGTYDYDDLLNLLAEFSTDADLLALAGYSATELDTIRSLSAIPRDFTGQINADEAFRAAGIEGYENEDITAAFSAKVNFLTISDYERFRDLLGLTGPRRPRLWFPEQPDLIESETEVVADGATA